MADFEENDRPTKRPRLNSTVSDISPEAEDKLAWTWPDDLKPTGSGTISPPPLSRKNGKQPVTGPLLEPSPFQLTKIRDLPGSHNIDTLALKDILNDPLIKENWQFNFLFDVDFVMNHLDGDVRDTIKTKIVHGFHDKTSVPRTNLEAAANKYPNVQSIPTYVPNYGTHHSKMMILVRHDDTAQVVIHTANMISQDWTNMCQAVWRSPLLPLLPASQDEGSDAPIGSGQRFKQELLNYLGAYKDKYKDPLRPLIDQLKCYDFSAVKAAIVASVPGKQQVTGSTRSNSKESLWGWPGLERVLSEIPASDPSSKAQINIQISSIGTSPEKWLEGFFDILETASVKKGIQSAPKKAAIKVIFPTADEIRRSLDGYQSGSSIHMKLDSQAQKTQLKYMKPLFCTWSGDGKESTSTSTIREAGRRRAAPHIKTFTKFTDAACEKVDWAMVTSANLSKQAWGEMANKANDVTTRSYEIGVVVCPRWLAEKGQKTVMVPVFMKDSPEMTEATVDAGKVVGFRMPYDLPLVPYAEDQEPWCAERSHLEPDWKQVVWQTYNPRV